MKSLWKLVLIAATTAGHSSAGQAGTCTISTAQEFSDGSKANLVLSGPVPCCGSFLHAAIPWSRLTGISLNALAHDGDRLTALLKGDSGQIVCSGLVKNHTLTGSYTFSANAVFAEKMSDMGFQKLTPEQEQAFLLFDISGAWVHSLLSSGIHDLSTNTLLDLRAYGVDSSYPESMSRLGYSALSAPLIIRMRVAGVTAETTSDVTTLGLHPSLEELIQMKMFGVDSAFINQARKEEGTSLTPAQLIQLKLLKSH